MSYQTIEVTSVSEILELINGKHSFFESATNGYCYRGMGSENWSLIPSTFRGLNRYADTATKTKALIVERDIYRGFYNRFRGLRTSQVDMSSSWEILCYAQHFGIPTRLLDWTANPLISLYFAVTEMPNENAALWCLARANGRYELGVSINQLPTKLNFLRDLSAQKFQIVKSDSDPQIVVIQPPEIDLRIRNQTGLFSVQYSSDPDNLAIDHVDELGKKADILLKIRIPSAMKLQIKRDLEKFGIDAAFVYPDMQGIAQRLREQREAKYVEQEISMSPSIAHVRDTFAKKLEALIGDDDFVWEWHPGKYHELTLVIEEKKFAVRVEQINLDTNFEDIKSFVDDIERTALEKGILKGAYYINWGAVRTNWQELSHQTLKRQILEIIERTYGNTDIDEIVSINNSESLSISKTENSQDSVSIDIYPFNTWWEGSKQELSKLQESTIEKTFQSIKLDNEFPTILILSIFDKPEYSVQDYARYIRNLTSNSNKRRLEAVFLITHFDSDFVVNHIFGKF